MFKPHLKDHFGIMKIGIISQSPSVTTGFGIVCGQIAYALASANHEVVCFGIGAFGETFDRRKFPYRIWAVGEYNLVQAFSEFLQYEKIEALLISLDILAVQYWVNVARAVGWDGSIIVYFVIDGLPIDSEYLEVLNTVQAKITATQVVANYLKNLGFQDVIVAPHGVDSNIFKPLENRSELRRKAGLDKKFLVGVFGRNNERKQQPRVMAAISELKKSKGNDNILLYLHCQPRDIPSLGGWDLLAVAKELKIEDSIIFPESGFNQLTGTTTAPKSFSENQNVDLPYMPSSYNYIQRINCCDLIINVSYCGGFELGIIEAQACGVPVAVTNDKSIMAEVAGNGAYMLEPIDAGIWRTGAKQFLVSPHTIAETIARIKNDSALKEELRHKGLSNASKFLWDKLHCAIIQAVQSIQ